MELSEFTLEGVVIVMIRGKKKWNWFSTIVQSILKEKERQAQLAFNRQQHKTQTRKKPIWITDRHHPEIIR